MKLAIFGGSFNPIHIGHLAMADSVHNELGYDKVLLIPTFISPFKREEGEALSNHRLNMIDLTIKDIRYIDYDDYEIKKGGVSYTVDTVIYIYEKYKNNLDGKLGLVIGRDLVSGFLKWRGVNIILEYCDIIIGNRPNNSNVSNFSLPAFPHYELKNISLPISSSLIRNYIMQKKSWRYLVVNHVYEYIVKNKLYETLN